MDYELEVFEVYDDGDQQQQPSKKHLKHTRKKCKQKPSVISSDSAENDVHRSKSSVIGGERNTRRTSGYRWSLFNVFSKLFVCNNQRRYQSTVPDKPDSPCTSRANQRSTGEY